MQTGQILLQPVVIILTVQVCGLICRKLGQQQVIAEILAGLVLGPSLLGTLWPSLSAHLFPVSTLLTTMMASPLLSLLGYRDRKPSPDEEAEYRADEQIVNRESHMLYEANE